MGGNQWDHGTWGGTKKGSMLLDQKRTFFTEDSVPPPGGDRPATRLCAQGSPSQNLLARQAGAPLKKHRT